MSKKMLASDLLRGYPADVAEAIAKEDFGYEDVANWASDYGYYHCQECDRWLVLDMVSSEDGGATWTCRRCARPN